VRPNGWPTNIFGAAAGCVGAVHNLSSSTDNDATVRPLELVELSTGPSNWRRCRGWSL